MINIINKVKTVNDKNDLILDHDFVEVDIVNLCSCSLCGKTLNQNNSAFVNMDLDFGQYIFCQECYRK